MTPKAKLIWSRSLLGDLRWGDGVLLLLLLLTSYYAWQWNRSAESGRLLVEISQKGQRSLYPLEQQRDLVLKNSAGKQVMLIKFRAGKIWVQESNCPLQYCVQRGAIDSVGQWIACLPNQVFIRVLTAKAQKGYKTHGQNEQDPFALDAEVF